jgi:hypothetical protein
MERKNNMVNIDIIRKITAEAQENLRFCDFNRFNSELVPEIDAHIELAAAQGSNRAHMTIDKTVRGFTDLRNVKRFLEDAYCGAGFCCDVEIRGTEMEITIMW